MKASEIITDDLLSKEKRHAKDVIGRRTTDTDYFGDSHSKKDHELFSPKDRLKHDELDKFTRKAVQKVKQQPQNEESLDNTLNMTAMEDEGDHMNHSDEAHEIVSKVIKQRPEFKKLGRAKLLQLALSVIADSRAKEVVGRTIGAAEFNLREDALDDKYTICAPGSNQPTMIFYSKSEAQEALAHAPQGSTVHRVVPKKKTGVGEGSMKAAAHKPEGAKFGGYWKGRDKGPPKPGQGVGGAA